MALPKCIFCENESGSEEHLWSAWMHRLMKFGPIRIQEADNPDVIEVDPEKTINTICQSCNNEHFSQLEQRVSPFLGPMIQGTPTEIDPPRLRLLIKWAIKTAMLMDSIKQRHGDPKFYSRFKCTEFRKTDRIPSNTRIWIGALDKPELHASVHDFSIEVPLAGRAGKAKVGTGVTVSIIVGQFVLQIVSEDIFPQHIADQIPPVDPSLPIDPEHLIEIYPNTPRKVKWPPKPFTLEGPDTIVRLIQRWKSLRPVARVTRL
jgi:hypothetical protein